MDGTRDRTLVDGDPKGETPTSQLVRATAEFWQAKTGADRFLTVSFSQEVYDAFGFKKPRVLVNFVRRTIERAGYAGPYVIVVHDNRGTAYFHPHILLKGDANGIYEKVKRAFFRYGDVNHEGNGPIEGFGAFIYVANRAFEIEGSNRFDDSDRYAFKPAAAEPHRRRHRTRGHGRGRSARNEAADRPPVPR